MDNVLLQPVEVLQQPYTGAAMYGWDVELDLADAAVGKFYKSLANFNIVKESIFLTEFLFIDPDAGMVLEFVIFAGIAAFQDIIYCPAPLAAKGFVVEHYRVASAAFPAMIAANFSAGFQNASIVLLLNCSIVPSPFDG
jgi:hypothetical protein